MRYPEEEKFLALLAPHAQRIVLVADDRRRIDLRVVHIRSGRQGR